MHNFSSHKLKVEFFKASLDSTGRFPAHVGSAVFERLNVIRDVLEWDRCLIMDHDMLALCDLAPYFEEDFKGNLLMGRLFGPGNTLGMQMARRGGLPEKLKYAENYPYFYMGPMMNLKAMREEGTWKKLLAAHEALGQDEQMALTIATEGRVKGVGRKWNLVPQWDHLEEGPAGPERSMYGTVGEAATWKDGLPEGIIHWTGWEKPWQRGSRVWRPDLWAAEETSWEALRQGWWEKPTAVEVDPQDFRDVNHLAKRGWRVQVLHPGLPMDRMPETAAVDCDGSAERPLGAEELPDTQSNPTAVSDGQTTVPLGKESFYRPFPNVEILGPGGGPPPPADQSRKAAKPQWAEAAGMVRFGIAARAAAWLKEQTVLPPEVVLRGPATKRDTARLAKLGYGRSCVIRREDWPAGGPAPSVLDITEGLPLPSVRLDEDLYLSRK